jgi:hypothetical protein
MKIIGLARRAIPLGVKLEECPSCQTIGSHAVARRVRWFEILSLQLIRLRSDHVLICGNCGMETPISKDVVKTGLETGEMEIDRDRPLVGAELLRRAGQPRGETSASRTWSGVEEDPAVARATYDHRLREVLRIPGHNRQALYAKAWPVLALIVAGAVALPGGSVALQAAGVAETAPSPTPSATSGPAVLTPSPSPRPTPRPTNRPFTAAFAWWVQAYTDAILPCYAGGSCDLERKISYTDGTSALLGEEAVRLAGLYRDYDSVQMDSASDCRQEHGSMFALLASIASEVSVIEALKPGESMPVTWRPALGVTFEPCTTVSSDPEERAAELRSLLADAKGELSKAKKLIKAKDWSGAEAVSERLTELAAKIARASARDFPAGGDGAWVPIRTTGWDLLRVSGLLDIKRLAAATSTTKLIDGSIAAIDRLKLGGS